MCYHAAPLGLIILILRQPVFPLTTECCMLGGEAAHTNSMPLILPDRGSSL
jgi:hypothetical protein